MKIKDYLFISTMLFETRVIQNIIIVPAFEDYFIIFVRFVSPGGIITLPFRNNKDYLVN